MNDLQFAVYSLECRRYTKCTHYWGAMATTSEIIAREIFDNNYVNDNYTNNNDKDTRNVVDNIANFDDNFDQGLSVTICASQAFVARRAFDSKLFACAVI